jgi:hypothetical protein
MPTCFCHSSSVAERCYKFNSISWNWFIVVCAGALETSLFSQWRRKVKLKPAVDAIRICKRQKGQIAKAHTAQHQSTFATIAKQSFAAFVSTKITTAQSART